LQHGISKFFSVARHELLDFNAYLTLLLKIKKVKRKINTLLIPQKGGMDFSGMDSLPAAHRAAGSAADSRPLADISSAGVRYECGAHLRPARKTECRPASPGVLFDFRPDKKIEKAA